MKKRTTYILGLVSVLVMVVISGCGKTVKTSDKSIDDFDREIENITSTKTKEPRVKEKEMNNGIVFTYDFQTEWTTGSEIFEVTTDKNKMLQSVTATKDFVDVDYFMEMSGADLFSDIYDLANMSEKKRNGIIFLVDFGLIYSRLSYDDEDTSIDFDMFMSIREEPQTLGGWKYSCETNADEETVTFVAEFVGEE